MQVYCGKKKLQEPKFISPMIFLYVLFIYTHIGAI